MCAAAPDSADLGAAWGAAAAGATTPGTILILESDLSIRKLLRRLLERRGYSIVELDPANDLAGELRKRRADLLILDTAPAAESSVNAFAALARAHPELKILALTQECIAQFDGEIPGRLFVLPKPFPLNSLVDSVDRILGRSSPPNIAL